MAARCYAQRKTAGWVTDRAHEIAETARLARRAGELGKDDAVALYAAGIALAFVVGDLDDGDALIDRALVLNPNLAAAWLFSGWVKVWLGEPEVAIEREARAMRLSPHDPQIFNMQAATAAAHFFAGRYAEALSWAEMSIREQPDYIPSTSVAAAAVRSLGTTRQRGKPWHACVNSCPSYAFPISRTCCRSGERKISIDGQKACEKPGCRNEPQEDNDRQTNRLLNRLVWRWPGCLHRDSWSCETIGRRQDQ